MDRTTVLATLMACTIVADAQIQSIATHQGLDYEPYLTASNGKLFYKAFDTATGWELHMTDGTAAGTQLVKDIMPGAGSSLFQAWIADVNGIVFFAATDGVNGTELWKSDGTEAGTVMVEDINPGPGDSNPRFTINYQGGLVFNANDATGSGLWKSDGTASGTELILADCSQYATLPVIMQDIMYCNGYANAIGDYTLWKSNGTDLLTEIVLSPWSGGPPSALQLTAAEHLVYFVTTTIDMGTELWRSDGYGMATAPVDLWPGAQGSSPSNITTIGDTAYFKANDGANGNGLYRFSPGSAPVHVSSIVPMFYGNWRNPYMVAVNGVLYFAGYDPATGTELYKSDGTTAGTVLVKDINPGPDSGLSELSILCVVGDSLYFQAFTPGTGSELWVSDLTEAGTAMVQDRNPGTSPFNPRYITHAGSHLFMGGTLFQPDGEVFKLGLGSSMGVGATAIESPLTVWPSPAVGSFNVSGIGPDWSITLLDAHGRAVRAPLVREGANVRVDMGDRTGAFLVRATSPNGVLSVVPVVLY